MKSFTWICLTVLVLAACSPPETPENSNKFSFDVPANTPPAQLTAAIGKAFFERYAQIDTSMVPSGKLSQVNILAYDSATNQTRCVSGYTVIVDLSPKPDPNFEGDFYGAPSWCYFFTGKDNHYEVRNPIVTSGASEDMPEEVDFTVAYPANGECALLGLTINSPVQVVGRFAAKDITFYYWSETTHELKSVANFTLDYAQGGSERSYVNGTLKFHGPANPFDFEYMATGDSIYTLSYTWQNGRYVTVAKPEDQSGYVLMVDTMKNVQYPLFRSVKNPKAAETINQSLQLLDFGHLVTDEHPVDEASPKARRSFVVKRISNNLLLVATVAITGSGEDIRGMYNQHYFNALTGEAVYPEQVFDSAREKEIAQKVDDLFLSGSRKKDDGCMQYLDGAWESNRVLMIPSASSEKIYFQTSGCDDDYLGTGFDKMVTVKGYMQEFGEYMTPYFTSLLEDSPVAPDEGIAHLWHGTIGESTAVTLLLRESEGKVTGIEMYDADGRVVNFEATFENNRLTLREFDSQGKTLGTIYASVKEDLLNGTWTSGEGEVQEFVAER
ncbi:MAG: hypothetical protein WDN75_07760 [Bacteroidota bacterium]